MDMMPVICGSLIEPLNCMTNHYNVPSSVIKCGIFYTNAFLLVNFTTPMTSAIHEYTFTYISVILVNDSKVQSDIGKKFI